MMSLFALVILTFVVYSSDDYNFGGCRTYNTYNSIAEYCSTKPNGNASLSVRVNMTEAAMKDGAVCIDGSVPVFYWRNGSNVGVTKYMIYFDGGGWCGGYEDDDRLSPCQDSCVHRASDQFGSSSDYEAYLDNDKGIMSTDPIINPLACNWNTVLVKYCDGTSYNSNKDTVVYINSSFSLHFRGWKILNGLFKLLNHEYGLNKATDVVIGGCSAGGLNIYMHIDYIHSTYIPPSAHFMGLIDSGFFMEYEGDGKFISAMRWLWDNMNMKQGLNAKCMQYYTEVEQSDGFECMFAQNLSPFIEVDVFNMQSRFDEWQKICELQSNEEDLMNAYGSNLTDAYFKMYKDANGSRNVAENHGVFLDSCSRHCDDGGWYNITINGYNQSRAMYAFYHRDKRQHDQFYRRVWFQNKTYPCDECCPGHP